MPRRNFLVPLLAFGMVVLFALILVRLLLLRYERGDVYPPYSTLRADPLGTRAYYEALQETGHYKVARGFTTLHRELESKPDTLFYLGLAAHEIPAFTREEVSELDDFVKKGGRVLITLVPQEPSTSDSDEEKKSEAQKSETPDKDAAKEEKNPPDKTPAAKAPVVDVKTDEGQTQQEKYEREKLRQEYEAMPGDQKDSVPPEYHRSIAALWGFGWDRHINKKKSDDTATSTTPSTDEDKPVPEVLAERAIFSGIEPETPWKSAIYFVRVEPDWTPLYLAKDKPVLIRRHWGKGEVVVATDSYFLSNEALRSDRRPHLLNLFAGQSGALLFDESHLGTQEQEGIMSLAEKFRLEGFLYGMMGVLLLFLWRNSSPLVPPRATEAHAPLGRTISGKDSRSGLVNLLRRNIPVSEILSVCLAEWKRGVVPKRANLQAQTSQMEAIVAAATNHPEQILQSYHDLGQLNASGKLKKVHATKS